MHLSAAQLDEYLSSLTEPQAEAIRRVRSWILEAPLELSERIETGKWYTGLLVYETPGGMTVYALGPLSAGFTTLHMMSYYGSAELQERHGATLKPFLSGKSCMKFRSIEQAPEEALRDIFASGPAFVELAQKMFAERKKPKRPTL